MRLPGRHSLAYVALLAGALAVALAASWSFGGRIDNYAYDTFFHLYDVKPWPAGSVVLAIDEASLERYGGMRNIRKPLADGLRLVRGAQAVAIDIILSDNADPVSDAALEAALRGLPNLVLPCDLMPGGKAWEEPIERFRKSAAALGHVHAQPDRLDAVLRAIPLEKYTHGVALPVRRWALALEAFRLSRAAEIVETPDDVVVGATVIPAPRSEGRRAPARTADRLMRIRYLPPSGSEPRVSLKELLEHP